jgi:hypothetical protein
MDLPDSNDPLDVVARKIVAHANKADENVISAAMLVREARRRVEAGEAGDVKWYGWAPKNIKLSVSRLRELQRIAAADDPAAELERQRKLTQKRVEEHRERKATERQAQDPERSRLIAWAREEPIEKVRAVLHDIDLQNACDTAVPSGMPPAVSHPKAA